MGVEFVVVVVLLVLWSVFVCFVFICIVALCILNVKKIWIMICSPFF